MAKMLTTPDDKRKHLEFLQGVINRMASNSFLFKGWSITIIAGISAFAAKDSNPALMTIPIVSTLLFWAVDAYYLMLERAFRNHYKIVAKQDPSKIDFNMKPASNDIKPTMWISTMKRPVLIMFYGVVLIMLLVLVFILNNYRVEVNFSHGA